MNYQSSMHIWEKRVMEVGILLFVLKPRTQRHIFYNGSLYKGF